MERIIPALGGVIASKAADAAQQQQTNPVHLVNRVRRHVIQSMNQTTYPLEQ